MFSNSIKRLSESLAQAQEQARQQRQRAQQRLSPVESRPLFDAENEEASFTNSEEKTASEEGQTPKVTEDAAKEATAATTSPATDTKDTTLPKEVRIKLAKLAKYEDRHPSKWCG